MTHIAEEFQEIESENGWNFLFRVGWTFFVFQSFDDYSFLEIGQ